METVENFVTGVTFSTQSSLAFLGAPLPKLQASFRLDRAY
jgi:hypothetical protein